MASNDKRIWQYTVVTKWTATPPLSVKWLEKFFYDSAFRIFRFLYPASYRIKVSCFNSLFVVAFLQRYQTIKRGGKISQQTCRLRKLTFSPNYLCDIILVLHTSRNFQASRFLAQQLLSRSYTQKHKHKHAQDSDSWPESTSYRQLPVGSAV
jgi:hypothetical protein